MKVSNLNKYLLAVLTLIVISNAGYTFYLNQKVDKIVVVDVIKVVNEFKLKIDLEKQAEGGLMFLKNKSDSLQAMLDYALKNQGQNVENIQQELVFWQEKSYKAYEAANQSINEQTWKRLNPLIDEFGKKAKCRIIIGANGMGSVLYNDEKIDKTKELIEFINTNYEKGGK